MLAEASELATIAWFLFSLASLVWRNWGVIRMQLSRISVDSVLLLMCVISGFTAIMLRYGILSALFVLSICTVCGLIIASFQYKEILKKCDNLEKKIERLNQRLDELWASISGHYNSHNR